MDVSPDIYKVLKYNNILTCLYLPVVISVLNYTGNLYSFGKKNTYIEYALILGELLKFQQFYKANKNVKKKFGITNILKTVFTCLFMVLIFYIGAVLFGAPLLTEQHETLFFAILMTILTVLPVCLYLDVENVYTLFSSLMLFEGNKIQEHFLLNIRFCVFGAWLGAVVIPLDWNKPYQDWPIPCCYGALAGCFIGNLVSSVHYAKYGYYDKRKGKFGL